MWTMSFGNNYGWLPWRHNQQQTLLLRFSVGIEHVLHKICIFSLTWLSVDVALEFFCALQTFCILRMRVFSMLRTVLLPNCQRTFGTQIIVFFPFLLSCDIQQTFIKYLQQLLYSGNSVFFLQFCSNTCGRKGDLPKSRTPLIAVAAPTSGLQLIAFH